MEGWDADGKGRPTDRVFRRWKRFGESGARLVWGGEAVAVREDGRANPRQLMAGPWLGELRQALVPAEITGLQLTHSGRYSHAAPRILYRHPVLDRRMGLPADYPLLSDGEIRAIVQDFVRAAVLAKAAGFGFVDLKHCHGYLGHELLSARDREGDYGGSFENRTRFLREAVQGIRASAPGLEIAVRLSAFDTVPFRRDPGTGIGVPEPHPLPYRWGFGVNAANPLEPDLEEPARFLALCRELGIRRLSLTAGSPYTNPHIQRPATRPPLDGYLPPEEPLEGLARQVRCVRALKLRFPDLELMGSGYACLEGEFPHVAQAVLRKGWADWVGIGRAALSYPGMIRDLAEGRPLDPKRVCRTFSDCTTAPRLGLPSGCYPLDPEYKRSPEAALLKERKRAR